MAGPPSPRASLFLPGSALPLAGRGAGIASEASRSHAAGRAGGRRPEAPSAAPRRSGKAMRLEAAGAGEAPSGGDERRDAQVRRGPGRLRGRGCSAAARGLGRHGPLAVPGPLRGGGICIL